MKYILILSENWLSLALLCVSAIPAAYMVLHDTGKARWFGYDKGFFGKMQYTRKYADYSAGYMIVGNVSAKIYDPAPDNWYYRFFKIEYKEAFLFSATFLVSFVDAYHTSQLICRILMSLSLTLAIGAPWYFAGVIWVIYATIHWLFYKLLSR